LKPNYRKEIPRDEADKEDKVRSISPDLSLDLAYHFLLLTIN